MLVPLHALRDSRRWTPRPDRLRIVGRGYDAADDASHSMVGDPLNWFDIVVHQHVGTAVTFLD